MEKLGEFYYNKVLPAYETIRTAQCLYGNIALSYNGGKDCTVLLEIIERFNLDIPIVAFDEPKTFPELRFFTMERLRKSPLRKILLGENIRQEMSKVVDWGFQAILLGQRLMDPSQPSVLFEKSSPNWPQYVRVYPILNWTYSDIWFFLDGISAEYSSLYTIGYTSIGSMHKTKPNPFLDGRHARELFDPFAERRGRI
jgi:FAD synthetase